MRTHLSTKENVKNFVKRESKKFNRVIMGTRDDTEVYRTNYHEKANMRVEPDTNWLVSHPKAEGEAEWTNVWQAELWHELITRKKEFHIVSDADWIMQRATENYDEDKGVMLNENRIGGVPRELAWLIENGYTFMQRNEKGMNGKVRTVWMAVPTEKTPKTPSINYDYFKPEMDPTVIDIIQEGFAKPVLGKRWVKLADSGIIGKGRWVFDKRHKSELRKSARNNGEKAPKNYQTSSEETKTEIVRGPRPPSPDIRDLILAPRGILPRKNPEIEEPVAVKQEEKRDYLQYLAEIDKEEKKSYASVVLNSLDKKNSSPKKSLKAPVPAKVPDKTDCDEVSQTLTGSKKIKSPVTWSGPIQGKVFDCKNIFDSLSVDEGSRK